MQKEVLSIDITFTPDSFRWKVPLKELSSEIEERSKIDSHTMDNEKLCTANVFFRILKGSYHKRSIKSVSTS